MPDKPNLKLIDIEKFKKATSSRHHYIPRFLIKGFTNTNEQLYIYDKQKNEILKNSRPSKSIFFENDRNTLHLKNEDKTSIIEDYLYKEIDNKTSRVINFYQSESLSKVNFTVEDTATFLFFLISLFWRIPKTDYATNELMERSTITTPPNIDKEDLRKDPVYRKISRAFLYRHHIDEMIISGYKGRKCLNIHELKEPVFLIGDFPILFRKHQNLFSSFNDTDILFALNSNRVYSSTLEPLNNFSANHAFLYNACIIDQSVNYIGCGDLEILKYSIDLYQKLKQNGRIYGLSNEVFKT